MFENIGGRIKGWAKGVFIVETIAAIIGGLVIMSGGAEMIFIGLIVIACAVGVGYVAALPLYALGEIVDRLVSIDEKLGKEPKNVNEDTTNNRRKSVNNGLNCTCPYCSTVITVYDNNSEFECPNYKERLVINVNV